MKIIKEEVYVSLKEYSKALGEKENTVVQNIKRKTPDFKDIEAGYIANESGRQVYYRFSSLSESHRNAVEVAYGAAEDFLQSATLAEYVGVDTALLAGLREIDGTKAYDTALAAAWLDFASNPPKKLWDKRKNTGRYKAKPDFLAACVMQMRDGEKKVRCLKISNQKSLRTKLNNWKNADARNAGDVYAFFHSGIEKRVMNAVKINEKTEAALMVLASQRYTSKEDVVRNYNAFLSGRVRLVHPGTAELLLPDGCAKLGQRTITEFVRVHSLYSDSTRLNPLAYRTEYAPFTHRNKPEYSLSKLTMDDKQMAFTLSDGRVMWVYFVFDVASKALIGYSCSASKKKKSAIKGTSGRGKDGDDGKTTELFVASLANLFENLILWGIDKVPMEMETERHIAVHEKDRLEALFPFVRFCAAANPQEKHAEGFIKNIRYGAEKSVLGAGYKARPFARDAGMRLNAELKRDRYSEAEAKEIVRMVVEAYNGENDKLEVFKGNLNPEAQPIKQNIIARYTKKGIETTLRRNSWFQAGGRDWHLESVSSALAAEGDKVQAYILAGKAYVYQGDTYLGGAFELTSETKVQTAQAERTERDEKNQTFFSKYKAGFDKAVKAEKEKIQGWEVEYTGTTDIGRTGTANTGSETGDFIRELIEMDKNKTA